jgi:predicted nucleic acid-binding protein
MSDKTFIDTNVLVYAHDVDAGDKYRIANEAVDRLWDEGTGAVSVQVLEEFYVNVTRKIRSPLPREDARAIVRHYTQWSAPLDPSEIEGAFRIEDEARISFWDALIIASAVKSGATRILSEDLNPGQRIGGILIENPFKRIQ